MAITTRELRPGMRDYYKGEKGSNLDECPGAMFARSGMKAVLFRFG